MNRIRRRTIAALTAKNIRHELRLIPAPGLFDTAELSIVYPTVDQLVWILEYFEAARFYKVKVSGFGSADACVTRASIKVTLPTRRKKRS